MSACTRSILYMARRLNSEVLPSAVSAPSPGMRKTSSDRNADHPTGLPGDDLETTVRAHCASSLRASLRRPTLP